MIAFVTTVRHPQNCRSYVRVGQLLDATLRSVCRQTDGNFRVVVVHNEMPVVEFADPRVSYVRVNFSAPSIERTAQIPFNAFQRDKGTKCIVGVAAAKKLQADHVMWFDADDFLHRDIASFVRDRAAHPGWYSPRGFIHSQGTRVVQPVLDGFHLKNGSTGIVRTDLTGIPNSITTDSSQDEIVNSLGGSHVDRMFGNHGKWQGYLHSLGFDMEPLPFPSAIWEIGTGENHSGNIVSGRQSQPIDDEIVDDFGLAVPSRWSHSSAEATMALRRFGRRASRVFSGSRISHG